MINAVTAIISIYERFGIVFCPAKIEQTYVINHDAQKEEIITEDAEFEIIEPKQLPQ